VGAVANRVASDSVGGLIMEQQPSLPYLLRLPAVREVIPLSRATIYRRCE